MVHWVTLSRKQAVAAAILRLQGRAPCHTQSSAVQTLA